MRKGLIVTVGSIAGLAGAAVYFAGPAPAAPGMPASAMVVDGSPAEVLGRWRAASPEEFVRHEADGAGLGSFGGRLTIKHEGGGIRDDRAALWLGGEKLLVISTQVQAEGPHTRIDISAELPPSSLTRQPALSAQDRAVMAALASRAATDYAASLLGGQSAANPAAGARAVEAAFGLEGRDRQAFEARVRNALKAAFGGRDEAPVASADTADSGGDDTGFGKPDVDGAEVDAPETAEGSGPEPDAVSGEKPEAERPVPTPDED